MSKPNKGRLQINDTGTLHIVIEDVFSGVRFLDLEVSADNMALALLGEQVDCTFEMNGTSSWFDDLMMSQWRGPRYNEDNN